MSERELETEQNCNVFTPTLTAISVSFPFSWVAQPEAWGPTLLGAGFLYRILSPTDWTSCAPSYIIVQRPPSSCGRHKSHSFNPSTVKVIFWYSSTGCTCYLHRCISYFDSPAGSEVNIQHSGHSLGRASYSSAEMQLVYSAAPVDGAFLLGLIINIK